MPVRDLDQWGLDLRAVGSRHRAARVERAAARQGRRRRRLSTQRRRRRRPGRQRGGRGQQRLGCMGCRGSGVQFRSAGACFDDAAQVHHRHAVADVARPASDRARRTGRPGPGSPADRSVRLMIWAWTGGSRAETGSSATMKRGEQAIARAIPTRCRCPPENSCGYRRIADRRVEADLFEQGWTPAFSAPRELCDQTCGWSAALRSPYADAHAWIQRAVRVLKDDLEMTTQTCAVHSRRHAPTDRSPSKSDQTRVGLDQPNEHPAQRRLPRPGLPHQTYAFRRCECPDRHR